MNEAHLCPSCHKNTITFDGICYECRMKQERDEFLALNDEQIENVVQEILSEIKQKGDIKDTASSLRVLMYLRNIFDERITRAALSKQIYYQFEIYYHAPSDARDGLLARLEKLDGGKSNSLSINYILSCLAMIQDDVVVQKFSEFVATPPVRRKALYVGAEYYAMHVGWWINENGSSKALVSDKCYEFELSSSDEVLKTSVCDEKCDSCGGTILKFELNTDDFGHKIFKFCLDCASMGEECCNDSEEILERAKKDHGELENEPQLFDGLKFRATKQVPKFWSVYGDIHFTLGGSAS